MVVCVTRVCSELVLVSVFGKGLLFLEVGQDGGWGAVLYCVC